MIKALHFCIIVVNRVSDESHSELETLVTAQQPENIEDDSVVLVVLSRTYIINTVDSEAGYQCSGSQQASYRQQTVTIQGLNLEPSNSGATVTVQGLNLEPSNSGADYNMSYSFNRLDRGISLASGWSRADAMGYSDRVPIARPTDDDELSDSEGTYVPSLRDRSVRIPSDLYSSPDDHLQICPLCSRAFPKSIPLEEFEQHVDTHFH